MSWIIQSLLNKREEIKATSDIESDPYNDLLILEKKIEDMVNSGMLTKEDVEFLRTPYTSQSNEKSQVSKRFYALCELIANFIGGYFTDDGYLLYMKDKYKLTEERVAILRKYIKSEYRHKIMRKPLHE